MEDEGVAVEVDRVDADELVTPHPAPEQAAEVQRRVGEGHVQVIEHLRNAEREANPGVLARRHGAAHGGVHRRVAEIRAGPGAVLEVEQGDVLVLPDTVLVELQRNLGAVGRHQANVRDVETKVRRYRFGSGRAQPLVNGAALKRLVSDHRLELQRDLPLRTSPERVVHRGYQLIDGHHGIAVGVADALPVDVEARQRLCARGPKRHDQHQPTDHSSHHDCPPLHSLKSLEIGQVNVSYLHRFISPPQRPLRTAMSVLLASGNRGRSAEPSCSRSPADRPRSRPPATPPR